MLKEKLNLENIPHFKQGELERRMDDVLQLIDEGHSPVMIHDRNDRRFLMFSWEDFFNRFGWLYSKEEIAAIEAACAEYEENTSDLVFRWSWLAPKAVMGMTYCMSDIHGEILKWKDMLELIHFSDEDTLYVLGDVIDRNPHGIEILREIMHRPNIHMIVGNHEDMMLKTLGRHNEYNARRLWQQNGGGSTYREMVYSVTPEERDQILQYVAGLPDYLEIEVNGRSFYLVHGNVGGTRAERIWDRPDPPPDEPPIPGTTIICGHTCTFFLNLYTEGYDENSPFEIFHAPGLIGIDCGCGNETDLRRLACLRLEDMHEFYV